jgi:hypothetical protein
MRYVVVDLTGRHAPSQSVLHPKYELLQKDFYKQLSSQRHKLFEKEKRIIIGIGRR